jgi:hypothetical protein
LVAWLLPQAIIAKPTTVMTVTADMRYVLMLRWYVFAATQIEIKLVVSPDPRWRIMHSHEDSLTQSVWNYLSVTFSSSVNLDLLCSRVVCRVLNPKP